MQQQPLSQRGQKRREAILEAATDAFLQHGYDGTTLDMIITQAGGEAIGIPCDVTDPDAVHAMVASSIEAFGKVDIMVTNAALFENFLGCDFRILCGLFAVAQFCCFEGEDFLGVVDF